MGTMGDDLCEDAFGDPSGLAVNIKPSLACPERQWSAMSSSDGLDEPDLRVTWQDQDPASLLVQVGEWLEGQGRVQCALRYYAAAQVADPQRSLASYREGRLLDRLGRPAEALAALERAISIEPDHIPTCHLAARAAMAIGDRQRAALHAEEALRLDPMHTGACMVMLRLLADDGNWARLLDVARSCPGVTAAHEAKLLQALAFCMIGDREEGGRVWQAVSEAGRGRHDALAQQVRKLLRPDEAAEA